VPVVFRYRGIPFFFFLNEGNPREPIQVRALRGDAEAKFWLDPAPRIADSVGLNARSPAERQGVIERNRDVMDDA